MPAYARAHACWTLCALSARLESSVLIWPLTAQPHLQKADLGSTEGKTYLGLFHYTCEKETTEEELDPTLRFHCDSLLVFVCQQIVWWWEIKP